MICHMCKDKVATIRLKEIINNVVTELHLCEECFELRERKEGAAHTASPGKMLDSFEEQEKKKTKGKAKSKKCPACGTLEDQFRAKGRLGCGRCYETFAKSLDTVVSRIHNSTEHRGKIPRQAARSLDLKTEMRRLQQDLQRAILSENYERAAKLRDKIKQYENM